MITVLSTGRLKIRDLVASMRRAGWQVEARNVNTGVAVKLTTIRGCVEVIGVDLGEAYDAALTAASGLRPIVPIEARDLTMVLGGYHDQ